MKKKFLPYIPVCLIALAIIAFYTYGLTHKITFSTIQAEHERWKLYATSHPLLAALYFIMLLILSVCFVVPDSIILGVIAGFLFPLPLAILYIISAETLGAWLYFEAIRLAFFAPLHKKKHTFLIQLEKKISLSPASYLLFCRFSHVIPFWVINTAAACFKIKRWTFVWTTCVGVLPLSYIIAQAGAGLDTFFETQTHFSIAAIFNHKIELSLIGLAALALIPIIWKSWKKS